MMEFRQLLTKEELTEEQINKIGHLLFETDPFIFPCICAIEDCSLLGKLCTTGEDPIFALRNCFIAEEDGMIHGLILWHEGPAYWNPAPLVQLARQEEICLSPNVHLVWEGYFREYETVPPGVISIMNVCVDPTSRNCGIGTNLVRAFIDQHISQGMELYVLSDNDVAIQLYRNVGFVVDKDDLPAFTSNKDQSIRCKKMIRF